jgi:hypothetical protein
VRLTGWCAAILARVLRAAQEVLAMNASPSRRLGAYAKRVARLSIPFAVIVAALALLPLSTSAAPTSLQLVFEGHHVAAQCPPACNETGLAHVGTFTTNDALCPSGHAEDITQRTHGETLIGTRLFTCDGSSATFTATISPEQNECLFTGDDTGTWQIVSGTGPLADLRGKGSFSSVLTGGDRTKTITVTFRTTWAGTADLDAMPPTLRVGNHTVTKLRRPRGSYRLKLTLALSDDQGGPVSYSVTLTDPTTTNTLARRSGSIHGPSIGWTFVLKPNPRARALRLQVEASDAVGNPATVRQTIALKK